MELDRCSYKRCKRPVEIISQGRPLCEYHYSMEIERDLKRFLKEALDD